MTAPEEPGGRRSTTPPNKLWSIRATVFGNASMWSWAKAQGQDRISEGPVHHSKSRRSRVPISHANWTPARTITGNDHSQSRPSGTPVYLMSPPDRR
ncbi:MAG: hypothetical protein QOH34_3721 [Mycobacterium sp.]|jgi:hypothetical protein|nr:hypothetical protein [Mycobacterium sp.]